MALSVIIPLNSVKYNLHSYFDSFNQRHLVWSFLGSSLLDGNMYHTNFKSQNIIVWNEVVMNQSIRILYVYILYIRIFTIHIHFRKGHTYIYYIRYVRHFYKVILKPRHQVHNIQLFIVIDWTFETVYRKYCMVVYR